MARLLGNVISGVRTTLIVVGGGYIITFFLYCVFLAFGLKDALH